jgi:hypothetical protein
MTFGQNFNGGVPDPGFPSIDGLPSLCLVRDCCALNNEFQGKIKLHSHAFHAGYSGSGRYDVICPTSHKSKRFQWCVRPILTYFVLEDRNILSERADSGKTLPKAVSDGVET